jgi:hypothetical protein
MLDVGHNFSRPEEKHEANDAGEATRISNHDTLSPEPCPGRLRLGRKPQQRKLKQGREGGVTLKVTVVTDQ